MSPTEKRENTKQQKELKVLLAPIEEALEDAPLPPLDPRKALQELRKSFLRTIHQYKEAKAELIEQLEKYQFAIGSELEWRMGPTVELEEQAKAAYFFLKMSYKLDGSYIYKLRQVHEAVEQWKDEEMDRLMRNVRSGIGRSSNHAHNVVEEYKAAGIATAIEDYSKWSWHSYVRHLEMAENWVELHGEK
jgi:hypothetical protein